MQQTDDEQESETGSELVCFASLDISIISTKSIKSNEQDTKDILNFLSQIQDDFLIIDNYMDKCNEMRWIEGLIGAKIKQS